MGYLIFGLSMYVAWMLVKTHADHYRGTSAHLGYYRGYRRADSQPLPSMPKPRINSSVDFNEEALVEGVPTSFVYGCLDVQ